jgi:hypothetical protein
MTECSTHKMRFSTMIKRTVVTTFMLMPLSALSEGLMESIDPRDMSLGLPIEVVGERIYDLADERDYGTQPNGNFILNKSALRRCLGNYFYIHLGDEQYRSYEEEMEEDLQAIAQDKLIIKDFESEVNDQGALAKSQAEVDDYNEKVKLFNDLNAMQSSNIGDYNSRIKRLNDFGIRIDERTRKFAERCHTKDYYQDEYEDLILTVKEEMFNEFNRALNRLD